MCQFFIQGLNISSLEFVEIGIIAESNPGIPANNVTLNVKMRHEAPEVHGLLSHHVRHGLLLLSPPQQRLVVLPGHKPQDSVALGQLKWKI